MFGLDIFQQFFQTNVLYSSKLRVYPIATRNEELEYGDKIILPEDAFAYINGTSARYPLMFKLSAESQYTFCGVKEFSAERGMCYIPRWIMKKLGLIPGDTMVVTNININKATYVKFYFRDGTFGTLSNPRAVLENKLKNFSVFHKNDTICIEHLGKEYTIDIVDCKPDNIVDIVETDVNVDIEYNEVQKPIPVIPPSPKENNSAVEQVEERSSVSSSKPKTLNKFKTKKNYFSGSGHSLQQEKRSVANQRNAFRRENNTSFNNDTNTMYDNRFTERDKSIHFSGKGHKLC